MVGEHHNRLAVCGNLNRTLDNAVREDVHARLGLNRSAAELGGHAVGILRDGVERGFEIKKTLFGEGVILRAEYDAKQREFLRADEAVRAQRGQRPIFQHDGLQTLFQRLIPLLRQFKRAQNGQNVARLERAAAQPADMAFEIGRAAAEDGADVKPAEHGQIAAQPGREHADFQRVAGGEQQRLEHGNALPVDGRQNRAAGQRDERIIRRADGRPAKRILKPRDMRTVAVAAEQIRQRQRVFIACAALGIALRLMAVAAKVLNGGQRPGRNDVKRHGVSPPRVSGCVQTRLRRWGRSGCGRPPHRAAARRGRRASAGFGR